ncbi:MAG: hypothetical protein IID37_08910, partial [Planctomycetes bacterium]|nr:hypothetical protein [Planctomycetota bacterium]
DGTDTLTNIENVTGSAQGDTLTGDADANVLDGGGGSDSLAGGGGKDTFRFTGAKDGDVVTVDGGQENDTIDLSAYSSDKLTDDGSTITVDLGNNESFTINYSNIESITTSDGTFAPGGGGGFTVGADTWTGTKGDDVADGLGGDDILDGGQGQDTLHGGDGNDFLYGGKGGGVQDTDILFGDAGNDYLDGGLGNDILDGGTGDDQLFGGGHDDVLISGGGNDAMDGGGGNDTFRFTGAQDGDVITVDGGAGNDTIDLSTYSNDKLTDDGSTITVDLGNDQSFTINYSNIETITTSEGSYAPGAIGGAPNADAGADQSVNELDQVTLDATGSSDPDNDTLSYQWVQTSGPSVTLSDATAANPTFNAPEGLINMTLSFQLQASDGIHTNTDTVTITVNADDDAPSAAAGSDQTVAEGNIVTLDATGSSDPEGQGLTYTWIQTGGPSVTLSDATAASPTFTAPDIDQPTTLTFQVSVSDGQNTAADTVSIKVTPVNAGGGGSGGGYAPAPPTDEGTTDEPDPLVTGEDSTEDGDEDTAQDVMLGETEGSSDDGATDPPPDGGASSVPEGFPESTDAILVDEPATPVDSPDLDAITGDAPEPVGVEGQANDDEAPTLNDTMIAEVEAGGDDKQDDVSVTSDPAPIDWTDVTELDVMDPRADVSDSIDFNDESEALSDESELDESSFTLDDPVQRDFHTAEQGEFVEVPAAVGTPALMIEFDTGDAKFEDVFEEVAFKDDPYATELPTDDALVHRAASRVAGHSTLQAQEDLEPLAFSGDGSGRHHADDSGDASDPLSKEPEWSSGRRGADADEAASARAGGFFARLWGAVRGTGGLVRRADNDSTSERRGTRRS